MARIRCWIGHKSPQSDEIHGKTTVGELKKRTAASTNCPWEKLDVIFCGQKLNDDLVLENCPGFSETSIIYVVEKPENTSANTVMPPPDEMEALLSSLQATLLDTHHRALLTRIVSNGDTLQNLIDCVPGLRQDTVAQGVLKDPYLLAHWVTDDNVLRNFYKHPSLFDACQYIMNCLHAEVVRSSGASLDAPIFPPPPPPGVNVGDPFESDEDEDEVGGPGGAAGGPAGGPQITPQQLAAALAMATGRAQPPQQQPARAAPQPSTNIGRPAAASAAPQQPVITPNMLQMAMQQALAAANVQQPAQQMQSQLQQLRDMGFLNVEENARALRLSNGDVMGAVEIIIAIRERQEQGFGLD